MGNASTDKTSEASNPTKGDNGPKQQKPQLPGQAQLTSSDEGRTNPRVPSRRAFRCIDDVVAIPRALMGPGPRPGSKQARSGAEGQQSSPGKNRPGTPIPQSNYSPPVQGLTGHDMGVSFTGGQQEAKDEQAQVTSKENEGAGNKADVNKSKVAELASKFSLKDTEKRHYAGNISEEGHNTNPPSSTFSQERLYYPQPKRPEVEPLSAPACQLSSRFGESLPAEEQTPDNRQPSRACSDTVVSNLQQGVGGQGNALSEGIKDIHSQSPAPTHNDGTASSSDEPSQLGSPGISIKTGSSIQASETAGADQRFADDRNHGAQDALAQDNKSKGEPHREGPFVVSSNQYGRGPVANEANDARQPVGLVPTASSFRPSEPVSYGGGVHPASWGQPNATAPGGYGPVLPYPNNQNAPPFEYQLASYMDSIHHHLSTVVHGLSKTFVDNITPATTQLTILSKDILNLHSVLNSKNADHAEVLQKLTGTIEHVQDDTHFIRFLQEDARDVDQRLKELENRLDERLERELGNIKAEITRLSRSSPESTGDRPPTAPLATFTGPMDAADNGESGWNMNPPAEEGKNALTGQNVVSGSLKQCLFAKDHTSNEHAMVGNDTVPTPTAGFRTPPSLQEGDHAQTDAYLKDRCGRSIPNPAVESSGSPTPKAARLNKQTNLGVGPSENPLLVPKGSKDPEEDVGDTRNIITDINVKTPRNKKPWKLRKRKDREASPSKNKEPHSKQGSVLTSHSLSLPLVPGIQSSRDISPSNIHPALRNPEQQQQMRQREAQQIRGHHAGNPTSGRNATRNTRNANPLAVQQGYGYRPSTFYGYNANNQIFDVNQQPTTHLSTGASMHHPILAFGPHLQGFPVLGSLPPHTSPPGTFEPGPGIPWAPVHYHQQDLYGIKEPDPVPAPWMSHVHTHPSSPGRASYQPQANWSGPNWRGNNRGREPESNK